MLDQVADIYSVRREECGRFFIDQRGAFFKGDCGADVQFVQWDSGEEKLLPPQPAQTHAVESPSNLTYAELLESMKVRRIGKR